MRLFGKKKVLPLTISIPEPCSENWDNMRVVDDSHRHCRSCERTLTDFSLMSDDELILFFRNNNEKLCGRFLKTQINRPLMLRAPANPSSTGFLHKLALLLPLSLFTKDIVAQSGSSATQIDTSSVANVPDTLHENLNQEPLSQIDSLDSSDSSLTQSDTNHMSAPNVDHIETPSPLNAVFCPNLEDLSIVTGFTCTPEPGPYISYKTLWENIWSKKNSNTEEVVTTLPGATTETDPNKKTPPSPAEAPQRSWYEFIVPERTRKWLIGSGKS
ncbi:MAG: hypothetical protein L6Q81_05880 [Bacteroidia bacterium]|nr:hypothetical protein [Bacteroidia bacterium]